MAEVPDVGWLLVAIAILALFVWYFWHVVSSVIGSGMRFSDYLDSRSERLRQQLEYEARFGRPPFLYRAAQKAIIVIIIAGSAALVWNKFRGA